MSLYRVRTAWTGGNGGALLSTMFFETTGGTAAQANTAVGTFWGSLASIMTNQLTWRTETSVYTIDEATGQPTGIDAVTSATGSGSVSSDPLPYSQQAVCQWRTGTFIAGRELRGRTFIPGMCEVLSSNGRPDSAVISAVNAAGAALIADTNTLFGVYSLEHKDFEWALTASCWSEWGVLRSRRQ